MEGDSPGLGESSRGEPLFPSGRGKTHKFPLSPFPQLLDRMAAPVTIRVRFDGGAYQRVRLAPGMSEGGVKEAVAGAVGLAVGTFFIRDADGVVEGFHAGLAGDYDAVLLPGQLARGAGAGSGGVAVEEARMREIATEVARNVAAEYVAARRRR